MRANAGARQPKQRTGRSALHRPLRSRALLKFRKKNGPSVRVLAGLFDKSPVERGMNLPQLRDRRFDTALLLLEQFDLLHALLAGQMQAAIMRSVQKMLDFGESEAQPSAGQDELKRLRSLSRYSRVAPWR